MSAAPFGLVTTAIGEFELRLWALGVPEGIRLGVLVRARGDEPVPHLTVGLTVPDGAVVESDGTVADGRVSWERQAVPGNEWVGPHTALARFPDGDPETATTQAFVRWAGPSGGSRASGTLGLAGLNGETGVRKTLLPAGLTILTRERPDSETVAVVVAVRAGSRDEDDQSSGGSHWLEHAHFLGTPTRPNNQAVFGAVEAVGGEMNATTSWELTDYFVSVPAEHLDLALDVLSDMLLGSTFDEEAFNRERKVVFEEMNRRANTPGTLAFDTFYKTVFAVHPARRPVGGTIDTIRDLPIRTILDYRHQRYVAGNMTIALVGRIQADAVVDRVEAAFGTVGHGSWIDRETIVEPAATDHREVRIALGTKQAQVFLGGLAPSLTDDDLAAYFVLDGILDAPGRRLAVEIRDRRGLATSVGSSYFGLTDSAAWAVSALTQPENVDEVVSLFRVELGRLRDEPVSESEISDSVRSIRGSRQIGEERNLGQARRLAREVALGILRPNADLDAQLAKVTPADVQRVAQRCFDLEHDTLVVVTF